MNDFQELHNLKQSDCVIYYSFYDKEDDTVLPVKTVTIKDGKFDNITFTRNYETITYTPEQYYYTNQSLFVLGIGVLLPGDIIKLFRQDCMKYELNFGWHTNISEQNIYSWYLKPINPQDININKYNPDGKNLTLYKEYLDTIEVVEFKSPRITFY